MERDEEITIADVFVMANNEKRAWELLRIKLDEGWEKYRMMCIEEVEQEEKVLGIVINI